MKTQSKVGIFVTIVLLCAVRSYILLGQQSAGFSTLTPSEQKLVEVEKQRFAAQVNQDVAALENILADDLVYCHSSGSLDTKESFINSIKSGKLRYLKLDSEEIKVRIYGKTAILTGVCAAKMLSNGNEISTKFRYTDAYVKRKGNWQLVTWQSLRVN